MIRLTQRQIVHGVFGLVTLGLLFLFVTNLLSPDPPVPAFESAVATLFFGGLWGTYWRGWKYAELCLIICLTLLTIFGIPQESLQKFVPSVFVVPAIALVLGSPLWVGASALSIFFGMALRAGGTGDYVDPQLLTVSSIVIGAMMLSRLAIDNAERLAKANDDAEQARSRAEEERLRAEQQASELAQRNAEQQRLLELVSQLETPTIAVAEGVLLAPVIGTLDSRRAQLLTTRLLNEASVRRARQVILDIAGVTTVDTQVAQALVQTAQALSLLGCQVTLTGISPSVAATLTQLGVALEGMATARSPEDALAHR